MLSGDLGNSTNWPDVEVAVAVAATHCAPYAWSAFARAEAPLSFDPSAVFQKTSPRPGRHLREDARCFGRFRATRSAARELRVGEHNLPEGGKSENKRERGLMNPRRVNAVFFASRPKRPTTCATLLTGSCKNAQERARTCRLSADFAGLSRRETQYVGGASSFMPPHTWPRRQGHRCFASRMAFGAGSLAARPCRIVGPLPAAFRRLRLPDAGRASPRNARLRRSRRSSYRTSGRACRRASGRSSRSRQ